MQTTQPLAHVLKVRVSETTKTELEAQARQQNRKPGELARLLIVNGLSEQLSLEGEARDGR